MSNFSQSILAFTFCWHTRSSCSPSEFPKKLFVLLNAIKFNTL